MASRFYILAHGSEPFILVDAEGNPGALGDLEAAYRAARNSPMSAARGYTILEWDDDGLVTTHD